MAAQHNDGDVESPTSVEQRVGVDQELRTMKRQFESEIQEMKRQHENENQQIKVEFQEMKSDLNSVTRENQEMKSENQEMKRGFQDMKRQLEALQKLVKKSPAAKRKLFRRLETSDGGSAPKVLLKRSY